MTYVSHFNTYTFDFENIFANLSLLSLAAFCVDVLEEVRRSWCLQSPPVPVSPVFSSTSTFQSSRNVVITELAKNDT